MNEARIWDDAALESLRQEFGDVYGGRTVLVTGADGFMGSHLTDALVELGANVHAFVRATSSGALNNIGHLRKQLKVHFADLTDRTSIDYLVRELCEAPDKPYVFHLGAQAHVGESWHRPYETVMANTVGTLNLLQSIVDWGLELETLDRAVVTRRRSGKDGAMPVRQLRIQLRTIGPRGMARLAWRNRFGPRLQAYEVCRPLVEQRRGLEIGGPSAIFGRNGPLPLYPLFDRLDNCDFADATIWHGDAAEGTAFRYDDDRPPGRRYVRDGTSLDGIDDGVVRRRAGLPHARAHRESLARARRVEADPGK